jgi:hypothetical protein
MAVAAGLALRRRVECTEEPARPKGILKLSGGVECGAPTRRQTCSRPTAANTSHVDRSAIWTRMAARKVLLLAEQGAVKTLRTTSPNDRRDLPRSMRAPTHPVLRLWYDGRSGTWSGWVGTFYTVVVQAREAEESMETQRGRPAGRAGSTTPAGATPESTSEAPRDSSGTREDAIKETPTRKATPRKAAAGNQVAKKLAAKKVATKRTATEKEPTQGRSSAAATGTNSSVTTDSGAAKRPDDGKFPRVKRTPKRTAAKKARKASKSRKA